MSHNSDEGVDTMMPISDQGNYGSIEAVYFDNEQVNVRTDANLSCCQRFYPTGFMTELKALLGISLPMIVTMLLQSTISPVALMFCGHLGKEELDAVALANSMFNVTGVSIVYGVSTACDTLFAQVFGSQNRRKLGVVLQKSLLITAIVLFPCYAIHLNMENLLIGLGQDPCVAKDSGIYILILIPGLFVFSAYIILSKYLQNQNIVYPILFIALLGNATSVIMHYVLLYVYDYRTVGSAISQCGGFFVLFLSTILYIIMFKKHKATWDGWSCECLQEWGTFFHLAVFGMVTICIEWWTLEIGIIVAGTVGKTELGAQSIIFQMEYIAYQFTLGVGISASIRVGQNLGAGDAKAAKTSAAVAITFTAGMGLCIGIIFEAFREYLPMVFTNIPEVMEMIKEVLIIIGIHMIFECLNGVCGGIIRGSGRQTIGAAVSGTGYSLSMCIGIPSLLLTSLKLQGYWIGMACAFFIGSSFLTILLLFYTDWQKEVNKALKRTTMKNTDSIKEDILEEKIALVDDRVHSPDSLETPQILYSTDWQDINMETTTTESKTDGFIRRSKKDNSTDKDPLLKGITRSNGPLKPQLSQYENLPSTLPLRDVIYRRLLTVLFFLGILIIGLLIRLFTDPLPFDRSMDCVNSNHTFRSEIQQGNNASMITSPEPIIQVLNITGQ